METYRKPGKPLNGSKLRFPIEITCQSLNLFNPVLNRRFRRDDGVKGDEKGDEDEDA